MKLRYVGRHDVLEFSVEDFTRHGVKDGKAIRFDKDNDFTVDVDEASAKVLLELDPHAFAAPEVEVKGEDGPETVPAAPSSDSAPLVNGEAVTDKLKP